MLLIRRFEEKAAEAYALGKIGGFCHLYIGQEAVAVGSLAALRDDDYVISSYASTGRRSRGRAGNAIMAELFGKATGCSKGRVARCICSTAGRRFMGGHGNRRWPHPARRRPRVRDPVQRRDQVLYLLLRRGGGPNIGAFHETLNMAPCTGCR